MNRSRPIVLGALTTLLLLAPAVRADDDVRVVAPDHPFRGMSQVELANRWWQWGLSFPSEMNPLLDTTGAFSYLGDLGPIFFLGATTGNQTVTRTVTIGSDQAVFVPVFPFITWEAISAYTPGTYPNLLRDVDETAGIEPSGAAPNTTLLLTLNGEPLKLPQKAPSLLDFRQTSPELFGLFVPADNAFGFTGPPYPGTQPSVAGGWYVLLKPLPPGRHTLRFRGDTVGIGAYAGVAGFNDVTYKITVRERGGRQSSKSKGAARAIPGGK